MSPQNHSVILENRSNLDIHASTIWEDVEGNVILSIVNVCGKWQPDGFSLTIFDD